MAIGRFRLCKKAFPAPPTTCAYQGVKVISEIITKTRPWSNLTLRCAFVRDDCRHSPAVIGGWWGGAIGEVQAAPVPTEAAQAAMSSPLLGLARLAWGPRACVITQRWQGMTLRHDQCAESLRHWFPNCQTSLLRRGVLKSSKVRFRHRELATLKSGNCLQAAKTTSLSSPAPSRCRPTRGDSTGRRIPPFLLNRQTRTEDEWTRLRAAIPYC